MHRAKTFFYVSAGIFLLALSYHLGARSAGAQAPGNPVVATFATNWAVTANGDVYASSNGADGPWSWKSNVFSGGPVPTRSESFGALKSRYRGAAQPSQDR